MTITNSSTRLAALVAGVAVAVALMASVAIAPAQAAGLSASQVQAIVSLLASFGADQGTINNVTAALNGQATTGSTSGSTSTGGACPVLTRSLQLGSSGADVMSLQKFLNANAATRVAVSGAGSPGMETTYFGPATQSAVIKFQAANSVSAIGVVGPATRAAIAAVCGTTGSTGGTTGGSTGSVTLQGGEGSLDINGTLGDVENSVDEGDSDVKVLGVELEAKDSDIAVERVDVDFTLSGTGSTRLTNYIDSATLWLGKTKLATIDASDIKKDSGDVYSFRFTGLKANAIKEDDQADLYVSVDAVSNVDSGDINKNIQVEIPQDGIRAVDGAGISDTYVSNTDNLTETFNVDEASSGDVTISEGDDNVDSATVQIDEEDDTTGVLALEFDLKAKNSDVNVDTIPVSFKVTGASNVSGAVKRAILKMDGKVLDTKTISGTGSYSHVSFDDLNLDINKDDTATFDVYVDLNDQDDSTFPNGSTLYASTTASDSAWDIEDNSGDAVTPSGSVSNQSNGVLTFQVSGVSVSSPNGSTPSLSQPDNTDISTQRGTFTMTFDVTAFNEDRYIQLGAATRGTTGTTTGANYTIESLHTNDNGAATTSGSIVSAVIERVSGGTVTGNFLKISEGSKATLRLTVVYDAAFNAPFRMQLYGVNTATSAATTFNESTVVSPTEDYQTQSLTISNS